MSPFTVTEIYISMIYLWLPKHKIPSDGTMFPNVEKDKHKTYRNMLSIGTKSVSTHKIYTCASMQNTVVAAHWEFTHAHAADLPVQL